MADGRAAARRPGEEDRRLLRPAALPKGERPSRGVTKKKGCRPRLVLTTSWFRSSLSRARKGEVGERGRGLAAIPRGGPQSRMKRPRFALAPPREGAEGNRGECLVPDPQTWLSHYSC